MKPLTKKYQEVKLKSEKDYLNKKRARDDENDEESEDESYSV
jgi:hypothetical protein